MDNYLVEKKSLILACFLPIIFNLTGFKKYPDSKAMNKTGPKRLKNTNTKFQMINA